MDNAISEMTRILNIVLTAAVLIIAVCVLIAQRGPASSYARADRFSENVRLPYGSEQTRDSIAQGLRQRAVASSLAILAGGLVAATLLFTPLAESPLFVFYTLITALVVGSVIGTVVVSVRERLFHPTPDAPRIARARSLGVADYMGPVRRAIPWILAAAAAVVLTVLAARAANSPEYLDQAAAVAAAIFGVIALLALLALPWLERLILAQPQPASHSLELAWDDALRGQAIFSLRLSCSLASWFALALALVALSGESMWLSQLPVWGMIALQFFYPAAGGRMPSALYPEWLRHPASTGGAL